MKRQSSSSSLLHYCRTASSPKPLPYLSNCCRISFLTKAMAVEHSRSNKSWRRSSSSSFLHCCRTPLMAVGPLAGIDQKDQS
ncbi:hypothetical protein SLE2022_325780 [Rubroshorea leprosula]